MQQIAKPLDRDTRSGDPSASGPVRRAYRPREIARLYGLAPATVYAAVYEGRLRHHRVGKAIVVPVEAIEEWLTASVA